MSVAEHRRAELADFLRQRRASVTPDMVGLTTSRRRRTPGLRREEVAELADVGLSWYTWLEQGRDISPSEQVLDAIGRALLLTPREREHVMKLAGLRGSAGPVAGRSLAEGSAAELRDMLDGLVPHPAYLVDEKFDVVMHNEPAELVMSGLLAEPRARRNLLLWLFAERGSWAGFDEQWSAAARANLLDFREAYAAHVGEPLFENLVAELSATGEPFASWWDQHDVRALEPSRKTMVHPVHGTLELMLVQSYLPDFALRLRILVPGDQHTRLVLAARYT